MSSTILCRSYVAHCLLSLFKTIDFKATLTSTSFTADGASLLVGTDSGQLFVQDLRSLDKPPRKLAIGFDNEQILAMSVQVRGPIFLPPTPLISSTISSERCQHPKEPNRIPQSSPQDFTTRLTCPHQLLPVCQKLAQQARHLKPGRLDVQLLTPV